MPWTPRTRLRALMPGLVLMLLVPLLVSCNNDSGPETLPMPDMYDFRGEVRVSGAKNVVGQLDRCSGAGPFVDIYQGALVTVTNEIGKPIATGKVMYGLGTNFYRDRLDECTFRVDVPNVPGTDAYLVIVARQTPRALLIAGVNSTNGRFAYDLNPPLVTPGVGPQ